MKYFKLLILFFLFHSVLFAQQAKDGVIGKNIFSFFSISMEQIDLKATFPETSLSEKVSLSYYPADSFGPASASLRLEGIEFNLFYFRLDQKNNIVSVIKIQAAGTMPEVALSMISDLEGAKILATRFGISLTDAALKIDDYERTLASNREKEEAYQNLIKKTFTRETISDSDEAYPALQHEFVVARFDAKIDTNAIKTFGAGPCIIMVIYDSTSKVGLLAHIDASTDMAKSMPAMLERFNAAGGHLAAKDSNLSQPMLRSYLIGGSLESKEDMLALVELLEGYNVTIDKDLDTGRTESAWLDLETGEVYFFRPIASLATNQTPPGFGPLILYEALEGLFPLRDRSPAKK